MKTADDAQLERIAARGRGGDTEIGHLSPGEMVVPLSVLADAPGLRAALRRAFAEAGLDPDRYVVGAPENSVNPATGAAEYFSPGTSKDKFGRDDPAFDGGRWDRERDGQESDREAPETQPRPLKLPLEFASFIMEDGRRLEDVLGKGAFGDNGKVSPEERDRRAARARQIAERRAQAGRLNQTGAALSGAQGIATPANTTRRNLSGV